MMFFTGSNYSTQQKEETSTNVEVSSSSNYKFNLVYWVPITLSTKNSIDRHRLRFFLCQLFAPRYPF